MANPSTGRRVVASMRPRVFPAEDFHPAENSARDLSRFNEAAGIPRGRPFDLIDDRLDLIELQ